MAKSERKRQKKADAKRRRDRKHHQKQAVRREASKTIEDFRKQRPMVMATLKKRGHQQEFYDFLDSYSDAFDRDAKEAVEQYLSLLGVYQVDDDAYYGEHDGAFAEGLGHPGLGQIFFSATDVDDEYLSEDRKLKINGVTIAYRDQEGSLKTIVLIRKVVPKSVISESKHICKIIALHHELGHVKDWENGIHLSDKTATALIEAEIFAHEHAMQQLMDRDYRLALSTYLSSLKEHSNGKGYLKVICERLVESELYARCEVIAATNWYDHLDSDDWSRSELMELARIRPT